MTSARSFSYPQAELVKATLEALGLVVIQIVSNGTNSYWLRVGPEHDGASVTTIRNRADYVEYLNGAVEQLKIPF